MKRLAVIAALLLIGCVHRGKNGHVVAILTGYAPVDLADALLAVGLDAASDPQLPDAICREGPPDPPHACPGITPALPEQ
jgi:hypothetical protein